MKRPRIYEPYGYIEEMDYTSKKSILYNEVMRNRRNDEQEFRDIDNLYEKHNTEAFASTYYDKDLESVIFKNMNGNAIGSIKMTDIIPSSLVKQAYYDEDTQELVIIFDNDDVIRIDLNALINRNEAGDGLRLDGNKFAVKIASDSEKFVSGTGESFMTVDENGLRVLHIQEAIDVEKDRALEAERVERETRIQKDTILLQMINKEIYDRVHDVDAEEERATSAETSLFNKIETETQQRNSQYNQLQQDLATEALNREFGDRQLRTWHNEYKESNDAEVASLKSRVTALEGRVSTLQATVNLQSNTIAGLERRIEALENRI